MNFSNDQLIQVIRKWALLCRENQFIESAYLFGSSVYQHSFQFSPDDSDGDIIAIMPKIATTPLSRLSILEGLIRLNIDCETDLFRLMRRDGTARILSIIPISHFELFIGVHKGGDPGIYRKNQFLNLLDEQQSPTHFPDRVKISHEEHHAVIQAMKETQSFRNKYVSISANGNRSVHDWDGKDPLPKDLERSAAQIRHYQENLKDYSAYDVNEGLEFMSSLLKNLRRDDDEYERLYRWLSVRRGGRGTRSALRPRDSMLLWELLAIEAEKAFRTSGAAPAELLHDSVLPSTPEKHSVQGSSLNIDETSPLGNNQSFNEADRQSEIRILPDVMPLPSAGIDQTGEAAATNLRCDSDRAVPSATESVTATPDKLTASDAIKDTKIADIAKEAKTLGRSAKPPSDRFFKNKSWRFLVRPLIVMTTLAVVIYLIYSLGSSTGCQFQKSDNAQLDGAMVPSPVLVTQLLQYEAEGAPFSPENFVKTTIKRFLREEPTIGAKVDLAIDARRPGLAVVVQYSGRIQPISDAKAGLIRQFAGIGGTPAFANLYKEEIEVIEQNHAYWIPIQYNTLVEVKKSVRVNDFFTAYLRHAGIVGEPLERLFILMNFDEKVKEAPQKHTCFATAVLGIKLGEELEPALALLRTRFGEPQMEIRDQQRHYAFFSGNNGYFVLSDAGQGYRGKIFSIQADGPAVLNKALVKGLRYGSTYDEVTKALGKPKRVAPVGDGRIQLDFGDIPCSVEMESSGGLVSIKLAEDPNWFSE